MATTSDIRKGLCIKHNNDIYKIVDFLHVKPGKGPAFVRTKLKSVTSGRVIDNTFSAGHKIEAIRVETSKYQFLYNDAEKFHFMNNDDFNQIEIDPKLLDNSGFLKEGEILRKIFHLQYLALPKLIFFLSQSIFPILANIHTFLK